MALPALRPRREKGARLRFKADWVSFVLCVCLFGPARGADTLGGAAIASAHPLATAAGYQVMKRGGNAFDAAIAVAAALAVVEPYSSGLGGGGFWLLHRAVDGYQVMIDARETAPARVAMTHYLDSQGKAIPSATLRGGTAAGIPGVPAGLALIAQRYGRVPLAVSLQPAIELARDGFDVDERYARIAKRAESVLKAHPDTAAIFLAEGAAPAAGYRLRQPELSATLTLLATKGRDGFYRGAVAASLVTAAVAAGGVWQLADLEAYRALERRPVKFAYRGATIVTAALPSAGGVTLAQAFNILARYRVGDAREPESAHLVIEALRRGFHDRTRYLGDSDFANVPVTRLMNRDYAAKRADSIDLRLATPNDALGSELARSDEKSDNTTHYSVIDARGNRVAATLSINTLFGSGIIARQAGVLLNNEMDDFALRPEIANTYRLRGGLANVIAPGKRPLSSMTPTFVEDERGVLILGAPGGSRIISQVLLAILDYLGQREVDLKRIVAAPRYHHQYWPDRVEIEPDSFSSEWRNAIEAKQHAVQVSPRQWGNMQIVFKAHSGATQTASDPRGSDIAWY